jgi:signal peptidase I
MSILEWLVLFLVISTAVGQWGVFVKAGRKGWEAVIPFYSTFVFLKLIGWPKILIILLFLPIADLVFLLASYYKMTEMFGRKSVFIKLLFTLTLPISILILAFGKSKYNRRVLKRKPKYISRQKQRNLI